MIYLSIRGLIYVFLDWWFGIAMSVSLGRVKGGTLPGSCFVTYRDARGYLRIENLYIDKPFLLVGFNPVVMRSVKQQLSALGFDAEALTLEINNFSQTFQIKEVTHVRRRRWYRWFWKNNPDKIAQKAY